MADGSLLLCRSPLSGLASLHRQIDFDCLASYRLAGDYYLWHQFSNVAELKIASAYLGGHRHHPGQLSEDIKQYFEQLAAISDRPMPWDFMVGALDAIIWGCSLRKVKKFFNRSGLFEYDHKLQEWV